MGCAARDQTFERGSLGKSDPARYGPPPKVARKIATVSGCRVEKSHQLHDGSWAHRVLCDGHLAKVRFLANLAEYDSATPDVRRAAELIVSGSKTPMQQVEALQKRVQQVTFTKEHEETFSPTMWTLETGVGDCDDTARALLALLRSLGFDAGLQTLPVVESGKPPVHVAAVVNLDGWKWLETTIPARLGEHPVAAAQRLGIKMRPDLGT